MYKIYIKETLLILTSDSEVQKAKKRYPKADHYPFKSLKEDFKSLYIEVPAAGGIVINELGEALFIYKRGKWDLPKGKIEEGESLEEAAVREVMEETGLKQVSIKSKLCKTKHTFKTKKNKRAIKKSYWYVMESEKQKVHPQLEEDIEKVEWLSPDQVIQSKGIYANLMKVITQYKLSIK